MHDGGDWGSCAHNHPCFCLGWYSPLALLDGIGWIGNLCSWYRLPGVFFPQPVWSHLLEIECRVHNLLIHRIPEIWTGIRFHAFMHWVLAVFASFLYSVPSRVWTVPSLSEWKFWKIRDDFDPDGQLDSIAPEARSNPTARRGRNHLEFVKIF